MASPDFSPRSRRYRRRRPTVRRTSLPIKQVTQKPNNSQSRVILVWALLMVAIVALGGRLVQLQLFQSEALSQLAQEQRVSATTPRQTRYPIVDRQGNVLAVDQRVYTLYAHPILFQESWPQEQVAESLSTLLDSPTDQLLSQFRKQGTGIKLAPALSEETADHIRSLRIDGLELIPQQRRFYPQQQLFAPIVGFVNLEDAPQAGIEIAYQDNLKLPPAAKIDVPGQATSLLPVAEGRLQLTLDSRLQRVAQQALETVVAKHSAKGGTVLAMDAHTGEIIAFANVPTYDPNRYFEADLEAFRNWAVSDLYEPGSTFKPINVAIALEQGVIGPDDMVNDSGRLQFGKWFINNHDYKTVGGRGPISITDVLKYSSNVGMVRIMQKLEPDTYYDWLQRIGLDQPTGIDLPAEASGHLKTREQFVNTKVDLATTAFGQGFSMTPIKMLQLQGMLANGGKLVTPHVIKGLMSAEGDTVLWAPERPEPQQIFSRQTTQQVLKMMEAVVEDGTGDPAKLPGYRIGGKTGTAQKATAAGGYGRGRITSFVGILPVEDPRYVVLAVIDEPAGDNAYGSTVAAPLVKQVIESLVVVEGIPPTAEPSTSETAN
jgi:cell division protein FtsI (penicillin-binding protein 3)